MKLKSLLLLSGLLLAGIPAFAQVAIDLSLSNYKFICHEPIVARVLLRNDSGRPLVFGDSEQLRGELFFEIVDSRGVQVKLRDKVPEIPQMLLSSGQTSKELMVNLNNYYELSKPGTYRIYCWVSHPMMAENYKSPGSIPFIVESGQERWKIPAGRPDLLGQQNAKQIHKMYFTLLSIYKQSRNSLYIRIEDDKKIYALRQIGEELGNEKIDKDVDRFSSLHMIIPLSAKLFRYLVINLEGIVEKSELYRKDKVMPRLGRDENTGRVFVAGGEKAIPGVDFIEAQEQGILKADGTRRAPVPDDIPAGAGN
ncbi:MAG: hypothetical protein GX280_02580 [Lentisphaerae bacterium]|nr:hypothetical protein [Victivallaceae bacterium]MDD3703219.1 hypothetical protein [Victivallaceae bacterium]MDD5662647.1 hypothetical protein [Victivallaceae bacterium]NLK82955.1 hypothetical protein [Lentisphaerota bacterium]